MSEKWTDDQRAEYSEILKGLKLAEILGKDDNQGWSFIEANIRVISAGVRRQGVCYAFPPNTKFRIGP